jgi:hypothetical protein
VETAAAKTAATETPAAKTAMKTATAKTAMEPAATKAASLGGTNTDAGGKRDKDDGKAHRQLASQRMLLSTFRVRFRHRTLNTGSMTGKSGALFHQVTHCFWKAGRVAVSLISLQSAAENDIPVGARTTRFAVDQRL